MEEQAETITETTGDAEASKMRTKMPFGRIVLGLAAAIALCAVGVAAYRSQVTAPDIETPASQAAAPSVDEVIANLEAKLQEEPDNAEAWRMLGWSYFETERYAESATAMKRATSLDPNVAEYHSMLGEALVLASSGPEIPADARAAFDRALQLDPKDPRARYFSAAAKDMDGSHADAIEDWFALLKDTPADAPWAEDVRQVIRDVGKERGIAVEDRLAKADFAPAKGGFSTDGAEVAAAGIPGPDRDQMQAAAQLPKGQQDAMIQGMVDGLAAKLKDNPKDADGWIMLMRSRMTLGETQKAQSAYASARQTFRNDGAQLKRITEAAKALGVPGV